MDLVQWLNVQLDEDERIARAAAHLSGALSSGVPAVGERWRVSGSHTDDGGTYWSVTTASPDLDRVPVVEMVGSGMSGGGAHTEEVAVHIAEHDPARVLREIDAKRDLVQMLAHAAQHHEQQSMALASLALIKMAKVYVGRPGYAEAVQPLLERPKPPSGVE